MLPDRYKRSLFIFEGIIEKYNSFENKKNERNYGSSVHSKK